MRKLMIALLLGLLTASIANAQAGKSKHQRSVTPGEARDIIDYIYLLVAPGTEDVQAADNARMRQERERQLKRLERQRRKQGRNSKGPASYREDENAADGGE